jgi:fatty-acid peroxygenase
MPEDVRAVRVRPDVDRSVPALLRGYRFLPALRARRNASTIETRLLGERVLCVSGADGSRLFYDESLIRRRDAVPKPLASMLFGRGAVHGLDGGEHQHRKAMFLSLLDDASSRELARRTLGRWQDTLHDHAEHPVSVFDLAVDVLGAAASEWAGIPAERVPAGMYRCLRNIVDGFGSVGLRHLRGRIARARAGRWATALIRDARAGRLTVPEACPLATVATQARADGAVLPEKTAAVELLNLIRPTVAVAWLIDYAALVLHGHPGLVSELREADDARLEAFALEVRRQCPFVPVLAARAARDFDWHGTHVPAGRLVVLDVYGTDQDPYRYPRPDRFDPDRFLNNPPDPFAYLPQGGGPPTGHRCPGERVAIESIKAFARALTAIDYTLPPQDLRLRLSRMPARVAGGVVVCPAQPPRSSSEAASP